MTKRPVLATLATLAGVLFFVMPPRASAYTARHRTGALGDNRAVVRVLHASVSLHRVRPNSTSPTTWDFIDDSTQGTGDGAANDGITPDSLCGQSGCPQLTYTAGGQVQYDDTHAYNIFWQPYGSGWSTFRSQVNTFFNDISNNGAGTGYYGDLTQYYQTDASGGEQTVHPQLLQLQG
jgi:hypothetical protein